MKILWVNPSFLDYRVPVYKRLYELSNGNFHIIFSRKRVPERVIKKIKSEIGDNAIIYDGEKTIMLGNPNGLSNQWIRIPFTKGLYKKIKEVNADIVIAEGFFQWTPKAIKYSILNKRPLLIAYEKTKRTERNCPKWRTLYRKIIDNFSNGYLCNGILTKEYLVSLGFNKNKLFTGGMSADSKNLTSNIKNISEHEIELLKQDLSILSQGIIYIYVGRLIKLKGVDLLLEAWKKHSQIHPKDKLIIVGGDILYESFKKEYNNKSIIFTGEIDYNDIYKYYAISDVFVIPTLEDNWSLVVPEAMACGLPIACSIYNGCYPELVHENENGTLFDPLKEETIIKALDYFHHVDLKAHGEKSIEIEKEYNYLKVSDRIYNAVKTVYDNFYNKKKR